MIYADKIGFILRFIFVFNGNLKKMKEARIENKILENELNTQWGIYFIITSAFLFVLVYNLF